MPRFLLVLVAVVLCGAAHAQKGMGLAMDKPLAIQGVTADRTEVRVHERVTLKVGLEGTYTNPFDSRQIALHALVSGPSMNNVNVPGFLYRPFTRRLVDKDEHVAPAGDPEWQVRLSFPEPGEYTVSLAADQGEPVGSATYEEPIPIKVLPADVPGHVRRHPEDNRYFVTDRGETLYLIGANVCWGGAGGTHSFDTWITKHAENGSNFFRVWLAPMWATFAMNTTYVPYDQIDLESAWRLDYVLGLAEEHGMRVMLCIDSFNILRSKERRYGSWEDSPYHKSNGGPITQPRAYFTDETMRRAYEDRLRYLVARYGYSTSVFAWEFWNEVDIVDDFDPATVADWHRDMAIALRTLDPWKHLIGTSHSRPEGVPEVDRVRELDFAQTHHYQTKDMARDLGIDRVEKAAAATRPHFHGEFGITHGGKSGEMDPKGLHLHNGVFSSVGQMQAGVPMIWWWDNYIEPYNLYPIFGAFARWIDGVDFVAQRVRPVRAEVKYEEEDAVVARRRSRDDDLLRPPNGSWSAAPWNKPLQAKVTRDGIVVSDAPLTHVMHGVRNHPDLHNPVAFELEAPYAAKFGVKVEGVSGHGGAGLQMTLDGTIVLDKTFEDTDGGTDTLSDFDGVYTVDVPKGKSTVTVENTGADWMLVAYIIPWLQAEPPVRVLGVQGEDVSLVWVQNRLNTWRNALREDYVVEPIEGAEVRLLGFPEGAWTLEAWDTWEGKASGTQPVEVGEDGVLPIALPPLSSDIGYRVRRDR